MGQRSVNLRNERRGRDEEHLRAKWVDGTGLVVEGQDFGPMTAVVSDDGEYEYRFEIPIDRIPELLQLLGAHEDDDIIVVLHRWKGERSREFERLCSDLRTNFWCWP